MMKKTVMTIIGAALLVSSCGTYTATGAYTGSQFGQVIGSAVGGINGGWRGHEVGTIVGTVGGAAAGAAIGSAIDRSQQRKYEQAQQQRQQRTTTGNSGINRRSTGNSGYDQSGYDPQGRGDDRIDFFGSDAAQGLEVRNIQIVESRRDGYLTRGEELTVVFEVMNRSDRTVRDVQPIVEETTRNRHIHISPAKRIASIAPHQGVRYTASVVADQGLKNGQIVLCVGVAESGRTLQSQLYDYQIPTSKGRR